MRRLKQYLFVILAVALMVSMCAVPASAAVNEVTSAAIPYGTYVYDYNGNPVVTPHAYIPSATISGSGLGIGDMTRPSDMEVGADGCIYILDQDYQVDMSTLTNIADTAMATPAPSEDEAETTDAATEETADVAAEETTDVAEEEVAADEGGESASVDTSGFHGRLIVLNADYSVKMIVSTFDNNGKTDGFAYPEGVTISHDGTIYIADTQHGRIVRFTKEGKYIKAFDNPDLTYVSDDFTYLPKKLSVDGSNNMFVVAEGAKEGLILLDDQGKFSGFVGAQQVTYNVVEYAWKNILTDAQGDRMESFVPTEYNNIVIDSSGFLYVTTSAVAEEDLAAAAASGAADSKNSPVKRLNPTGNDVLIRKGYFSTIGDISFGFDSLGNPETSVIEDVALGPNGRYTLLDSRNNRLFTYSSDGELLYAFSGNGYQVGNSKIPVSITYRGDELLLLDQGTGYVTVFKPTKYGTLIDEAYESYKQYDYQKSVEKWDQVLEENANFDIAYDGKGNACMQEEKYDEAVKYFRYSNNKERYSTALGQQRASLIENYLLLIAAVVIVLLFLAVKLWGWIHKRNTDPKYADKQGTFLSKVLYGFYIMIHPFDGFWDAKHEKRGSAAAASVIALFLIVARIISKFFTNYLFNAAYGTKISIMSEILIVVMPLLLWTLSNWCVTTLADGEGSIKDVYIFTCYALLPMALFTIVNTVMSHFIILDEAMYITFFGSLGVIWSGFLIFSGNTQTHRYTVLKSIISIVLAVVGMAIIVFLALVIFTTYQQIYSFGDSIVKELTYRI
ncbi:MAG: hypothetical protein IKU10_07600 [Clostridia bacterium]|nr:hypothetical protein [Clostridia bacterium]